MTSLELDRLACLYGRDIRGFFAHSFGVSSSTALLILSLASF
jgi:hypothetical protein